MSKTIFYQLFKIGKIPDHVIPIIEQEGVLFQEEGLGGSISFVNFRAPGKYYGFKRSWFSGSIILTKKHFLAFKYSQQVIGVPWNDPRVKKLNCFVKDNNVLCVEFDASTFNQSWSGNIQLRFSTSKSHYILTIIKQKINDY